MKYFLVGLHGLHGLHEVNKLTGLFMSQKAYAEHREKITGRSCSRQYINKLVKGGVIPLHDKKINSAEADLILQAKEEPSTSLKHEILSEDDDVDDYTAPSSEGGIVLSYKDHKSRDAHYSAELKRLKAETLEGLLLDRAAAEEAVAEVFMALRSRLVNIGQIAPKLINLKTEREIQTVIEEQVNSVLTDFCDQLGRMFEQKEDEG